MSYTKMQRYTLYCCFYRAWCHCDVLRNPEQHLNGYQTVELQLASNHKDAAVADLVDGCGCVCPQLLTTAVLHVL